MLSAWVSAQSCPGGIVVARWLVPERAHRIKLGLSRRLAGFRAWRATRWHCCIWLPSGGGQTTPFVTRIPLLLGVLYLSLRSTFIRPEFHPGHLDEAAVLAVGFFLSAG